MRDWWDDHAELAVFLDFLIEEGDISTAAHARDVCEKPWKFVPEHNAMLAKHRAEELAA